MQRFKLFIVLFFSAFSLFACSNNSSTSANKDNSSNFTSNKTGDSTYAGKSSLAYTIEGKHHAIKDFLNKGDGKYLMALFLNEVKTKPDGMVEINLTNELSKEVFNFLIENKGSTTILHYTPSLSDFANKKSYSGNYMSPTYKNYYADSVTVSITNINATNVAGTFSGKFLSDDDKPVPLLITDGSFDVLFTKDKGNN